MIPAWQGPCQCRRLFTFGMPHLSRALVFLAAAGGASAWYLPGIAVKDYAPGERIWLKVNSLTSSKTQVPYETYKVRRRTWRASTL